MIPTCRLRNLCSLCPVRDICLFACSLTRSFKQLKLQSRSTIPYTIPAAFCLQSFPTWLPEIWRSQFSTSPEREVTSQAPHSLEAPQDLARFLPTHTEDLGPHYETGDRPDQSRAGWAPCPHGAPRPGCLSRGIRQPRAPRSRGERRPDPLARGNPRSSHLS